MVALSLSLSLAYYCNYYAALLGPNSLGYLPWISRIGSTQIEGKGNAWFLRAVGTHWRHTHQSMTATTKAETKRVHLAGEIYDVGFAASSSTTIVFYRTLQHQRSATIWHRYIIDTGNEYILVHVVAMVGSLPSLDCGPNVNGLEFSQLFQQTIRSGTVFHQVLGRGVHQ